MATINEYHVDSDKAHQIWLDYQRTHDVSDRIGQAVGIDPVTGRMWFGDSAIDVIRKRDADGISSPLFGERVGSPTYLRKGGRR